MTARHIPVAVRLIAIAALLTGAVHSPGVLAQATSAATQTSAAAGVTVKVNAVDLGVEAATWSFSVVLDSHSQDLGDDLVKSASLVTDDGRQVKPTAWKGAAPGGHHREGVLEFAAPQPLPRSVELKISRQGEAQPRVFRWVFGA